MLEKEDTSVVRELKEGSVEPEKGDASDISSPRDRTSPSDSSKISGRMDLAGSMALVDAESRLPIVDPIYCKQGVACMSMEFHSGAEVVQEERQTESGSVNRQREFFEFKCLF